jgi:serine/threonine-protein kinase
VFSALVILALVIVFVIPGFGPKDVKVPDVSGMELDEAISELMDAGFKVGDTIEIDDEDVKEGYVIKTDPAAGKTKKEGTEINIYQSTGKAKTELPNYVGRSYDDVLRLLEKKNFKDIEKIEIFDESEVGTILAQNPEEGEEIVVEDTVLELTVSKGPQKVKLIDLTEYNAKSLQDYAKSFGLEVDMTKEDYHDTIAKGLVISQTPNAGSELSKGEKVTVVLSKGPKEIPPKEVTKEIIIPYQMVSPGQANEVQIYIEDMNRSMTEPFETKWITEKWTVQLKLTIPFGGEAGYKVVRDKSVIIEEVVPYPEN